MLCDSMLLIWAEACTISKKQVKFNLYVLDKSCKIQNVTQGFK